VGSVSRKRKRKKKRELTVSHCCRLSVSCKSEVVVVWKLVVVLHW
jgi:hypothetical protein